MNTVTDFLIIGGGVIGVHLAYQLNARRAGRILLVDRDAIASGSTGRSSAVLRQHYTHPDLARLARRGVEVYRHFDEFFGASAAYRQVGYILLVHDENAEALSHNVEMLRGLGVNTRLMQPGEIQRLWPVVNTEDVAMAAYEEESGYADPVLSTQAAAEKARAAGVEILPYNPVTAIKRSSGGGSWEVTTSKGPIEAGVVIDCGGPWASRIAALAGVELPVAAVLEQIAIFEQPAGCSGYPVIGDLVRLMYLRPEGHNLTLAGSADLPTVLISDPDSYPSRPDEDFVVLMSEKLAHRLPAFGDAAVRRGYTGLYECTPDHNPIMDRLPGLENFYCSVGFSGHGFKLGPAAGELMADFILHGSSQLADIRTFRLSRFAENDPVRGLRSYVNVATHM